LDIVVAKREGEELQDASGIFMVMEYLENDVKKLLTEI
jgi:hypothetical protein